MDKKEEVYWTKRYLSGQTGWDIGHVSRPIMEYIDQIEDLSKKILIPGAGNGYEAEYLLEKGFIDTDVVDISTEPLQNLKNRCPLFLDDHLLHEDFFSFSGQYDIILEQTFFSAIEPAKRLMYRDKMFELLKPGGKLVGLLWGVPMNDNHPPYGGSESEYRLLFENYFEISIMELCYNSIPPRQGKELFIKLEKPLN